MEHVQDRGGWWKSQSTICADGKITFGGHDMVRIVDRHGEALIWCRKCTGHARRRMGPKLMN